jgi:hypothetical protein
VLECLGERQWPSATVTAWPILLQPILADTELCQSMLFLLAFLALIGHARRIVQYRLVLTHPVAIPVAKF